LSSQDLQLRDISYPISLQTPAVFHKPVEFKRYDLALKTDEKGMRILLFIGEKDASGMNKGPRYCKEITGKYRRYCIRRQLGL
jgi:hypothetical protein